MNRRNRTFFSTMDRIRDERNTVIQFAVSTALVIGVPFYYGVAITPVLLAVAGLCVAQIVSDYVASKINNAYLSKALLNASKNSAIPNDDDDYSSEQIIEEGELYIKYDQKLKNYTTIFDLVILCGVIPFACSALSVSAIGIIPATLFCASAAYFKDALATRILSELNYDTHISHNNLPQNVLQVGLFNFLLPKAMLGYEKCGLKAMVDLQSSTALTKGVNGVIVALTASVCLGLERFVTEMLTGLKRREGARLIIDSDDDSEVWYSNDR